MTSGGDYDPADYDVVPTPIEEVQTGWSLVIKHGGHAVLFQVDKTKFSHNQAQGTLFTLESEPLASGEPLRVQGRRGRSRIASSRSADAHSAASIAARTSSSSTAV
jgi:hypothetical protein